MKPIWCPSCKNQKLTGQYDGFRGHQLWTYRCKCGYVQIQFGKQQIRARFISDGKRYHIIEQEYL